MTGASWGLAGYLDELTRRYRCITVDAPGAGGSGKPHFPVSYALELYVGDAPAVLDHEQVGKFAVRGFSRGGVVGIALAAVCPERIRCLVLTGAYDLSPYTLEAPGGRHTRHARRLGARRRPTASRLVPGHDPQVRPWRLVGRTVCRLELAGGPCDRIAAPTLLIVGSGEATMQRGGRPGWPTGTGRLCPAAPTVAPSPPPPIVWRRRCRSSTGSSGETDRSAPRPRESEVAVPGPPLTCIGSREPHACSAEARYGRHFCAHRIGCGLSPRPRSRGTRATRDSPPSPSSSEIASTACVRSSTP